MAGAVWNGDAPAHGAAISCGALSAQYTLTQLAEVKQHIKRNDARVVYLCEPIVDQAAH